MKMKDRESSDNVGVTRLMWKTTKSMILTPSLEVPMLEAKQQIPKETMLEKQKVFH